MSGEYHTARPFKYTLDPTGMRQYGFTRPGGGFHIIGQRRAAYRPDVETFIDALFRHADPSSYLALRLFPLREGDKAFFKLWPRVGDRDLIDKVCENIAKGANYREPLSFTPPVCTFKTKKDAKTTNLADGVAISVECDEAPNAARATLTALLGPATCIVFSGGEWTNPETGEIEDKVHLHWRLKATTRTEDEHAKLREARGLATDLVGADASNKPIVHPIRWPGSWHLKNTPRLARLEADPDVEIGLDDALAKLRAACPEKERKSADANTATPRMEKMTPEDLADAEARGLSGDPADYQYSASIEEIAAAVSVLPNNYSLVKIWNDEPFNTDDENKDLPWEGWNKVGMAIWRGTKGEGFEIFKTFSQQFHRYDEADTIARWNHYFDSPPEQITAGTLIYLANKIDRDWRDLIEDGDAASDTEPPPTDARPASKDRAKATSQIVAHVYDFPEESTIERYDWLYGRHLLRGEVSGTAAKSGTGKSTTSIAEALAMTSGKQLLHDQVRRRPIRVVLINLEDRRSTMDKRIAAAMRHYKLTKEDIGGRLIVIAKGELKIKITAQRKGSVIRNEKMIQSLIDLMLEHKADVLSVYSFRKTHGVQENDNVAIGEVIECYEDVADGANCGIHLWHHTRKTGGADASIEDARGAQAFIDSCRSVRILATMTKQEGLDLKIENYEFYFRSFNGKRNFAPPAEESYWYRLENIKLRNHTSDFEDDGDNVGVVMRWIYPQVRMPKITDNEIRRAQDAIRAGGPWRASQLSEKEPWVGIPIAETLGVNLLDARVRRIVAKLVKDWLKAGVLKVVVKPDRHREPREYVEVAAP